MLSGHFRQHFLNFLPLPHGHGSLRPTPLNGLTAGTFGGLGTSQTSVSDPLPSSYSLSSSYSGLKQAQSDSSSIVSPNSSNSFADCHDGGGACSTARCRSPSKSSKLSQPGLI